MFCIQCGTNNPDYASFCRVCGRQIEKENSVAQPSSAYNIVPPASEVFYAPGADSVPTESDSAPPSMPVLVLQSQLEQKGGRMLQGGEADDHRRRGRTSKQSRRGGDEYHQSERASPG